MNRASYFIMISKKISTSFFCSVTNIIIRGEQYLFLTDYARIGLGSNFAIYWEDFVKTQYVNEIQKKSLPRMILFQKKFKSKEYAKGSVVISVLRMQNVATSVISYAYPRYNFVVRKYWYVFSSPLTSNYEHLVPFFLKPNKVLY